MVENIQWNSICICKGSTKKIFNESWTHELPARTIKATLYEENPGKFTHEYALSLKKSINQRQKPFYQSTLFLSTWIIHKKISGRIPDPSPTSLLFYKLHFPKREPVEKCALLIASMMMMMMLLLRQERRALNRPWIIRPWRIPLFFFFFFFGTLTSRIPNCSMFALRSESFEVGA